MLKLWNTIADIYMGNNIEYDVKSFQVKTAIAKYTKVRIKYWSLTAHRKIFWYGQQLFDAIKQD